MLQPCQLVQITVSSIHPTVQIKCHCLQPCVRRICLHSSLQDKPLQWYLHVFKVSEVHAIMLVLEKASTRELTSQIRTQQCPRQQCHTLHSDVNHCSHWTSMPTPHLQQASIDFTLPSQNLGRPQLICLLHVQVSQLMVSANCVASSINPAQNARLKSEGMSVHRQAPICSCGITHCMEQNRTGTA